MYLYKYTEQYFTNNEGSQFWGSFWGAFFAFFFGLIAFFITYYISHKRKRLIKHKNALVKLEQLLNTHLDEISIVGGDAISIKEILTKNAFVATRFNQFKLIEEILLELGNIDLVNKYFSYSRTIVRFNADFSSINYSLKRTEDAFLAQVDLVEENKQYIISAIKDIELILNNLEAETKELLILVRINLRKIKKSNTALLILKRTLNFEIDPKELSHEAIKLEEEIKFGHEAI